MSYRARTPNEVLRGGAFLFLGDSMQLVVAVGRAVSTTALHMERVELSEVRNAGPPDGWQTYTRADG